MYDVKDGYNKFTGKDVSEPLILEPEDWEPAEWKTLCKVFGQPDRGTDWIVVKINQIESYITQSQINIVIDDGKISEVFTNLEIGESGVNISIIDLGVAKTADDKTREKTISAYDLCKRMAKAEKFTEYTIEHLD